MAIPSLFKALTPWSHRSLIYEATFRCNLKCVHCYNVCKGSVPYPSGELDTEGALRLVRKALRDSKCSHFTFTGGEPLLRGDLETLVAEAARQCRHVNIISNGTLLDDGRIKSLIEAGVELFELPLNSAMRDVHNMMSGGFDCFDNTARAAAGIRLAGGRLAFVFVATKHNVDGLRDALELGESLGASGFLFNRYNAGGECHGKLDGLMPSVEQLKAALRTADNFSAESGVPVGASIAIQPCLIDHRDYPNLGFGFCAAGTARAYYTLDPLGNVRPCNHSPTVLGNILETPLKRMAKGEAMARFMKARPALCSGCRMEAECQGGCKAAGEACYGSIHEPDPFLKLNAGRMAKLA